MILLFVIILLSNGEVIKLENNTHIHCIDDDFNSEVALFISPPLKEMQTLENNLIWEYNNVKDWHLVNGSTLAIGPITDKRWDSIPLNKNNYIRLNLNTTIAISVYARFGLQIFIYNSKDSAHHEYYDEVYKEKKWYYYTILSKNGTVYLFENKKIIFQENFVPTSVVFRNFNKQFFYSKHQDRKFWWSNKETEDEKPSTIKIPPTGKSCLFLYTSLCKECYLEVIHNNNKTTITSTKQQNHLMNWQMQRLEINPENENILEIYRKINTSNSTGHWTLDFSLCDLNNTVTYIKKEESSETNYTCNVLNINSNKRAKRSSSNQEKSCPPGKLGKNCDISCENVLDSTLPYCNEYCICKENTVCNCAWGYEKPSCKNLCKEGKWGLSCKEDCKSCTSCNKHTGKCTSQQPGNHAQTTTINLILILLVASVSS